MPQSQHNFIMTVDEPTAKQFLAMGFKLLSNTGGVYLFLNRPPKNFNFEQFDKTKFAYTNMLSI